MNDKQNRQTCCGCGIRPPQISVADGENESSSTLLSTRFGWRVVRSTSPNSRGDVEWRCPACWEEFRERRFNKLASNRRA
jgi:hypothetical protein